jgi:enamine deaminase RidA (YjgF/YER057c/UK114 family)
MNRKRGIFCSLVAVGIVVPMALLAAPQAERTAKETTSTQFINPGALSTPKGFTHVVVTQPGKLVYVSGQTARNASGDIVGTGDLRAQVTQALANLKAALAAAGATTDDLIKVNYYVVNLKSDQVPVIREVRTKYLSGEHPPASTLVGVTALAQEGLMIEIEAVAAIK